MLIVVPNASVPQVCHGRLAFSNHRVDWPTWFWGLIFAYHWIAGNFLSSSKALGLIVHISAKLFLLSREEETQWVLDSVVTESEPSQPPYGRHVDANLSFTCLTSSSCFVRRKHGDDAMSCMLFQQDLGMILFIQHLVCVSIDFFLI